jgi:hypothetical protein
VDVGEKWIGGKGKREILLPSHEVQQPYERDHNAGTGVESPDSVGETNVVTRKPI